MPRDILALLRGEPGPFLKRTKPDGTSSFFGKKNTDPAQKEAPMQTDMGGMMITEAGMTYGEADVLAASVDLTEYPAFVGTIQPSAYWQSPYEKPKPEGLSFKGDVWWSIYSFLATKGIIEGDPKSYKNQMEYLYNLILHRLVDAGVWVEVVNEAEEARWQELFGKSLGSGWRWFKQGNS